MTPGARTAAVIEILDLAAHAPADRVIEHYFRKRRYAGSRDRAAIIENVFDVLRRRGDLQWRIKHMTSAAEEKPGPNGRSLVLTDILGREGRDGIEALFGGEGYGPPGLEEDENSFLTKLEASQDDVAPGWARNNYPAWLDEALTDRFGDDLDAEMAALNVRAPLDLRVNTLKATRDEILTQLSDDDIDASLCMYSVTGIRIAEGKFLRKHRIIEKGLAEPQDEGSQIAAALCAVKPGQQVVDLCAGGGGKTLALAAAMENRGQIFACDPDPRRLKALSQRRDRAGVRNVQTRLIDRDNEDTMASVPDHVDCVLIDAPCSGTGISRRDPGISWRLDPDTLQRRIELQDKLLNTAASLVRAAGRLVYVTCSVLRSENEDRVRAFLGQNDNFSIVPVGSISKTRLSTQLPDGSATPMLTPHRTGTDGFFVAVLERQS